MMGPSRSFRELSTQSSSNDIANCEQDEYTKKKKTNSSHSVFWLYLEMEAHAAGAEVAALEEVVEQARVDVVEELREELIDHSREHANILHDDHLVRYTEKPMICREYLHGSIPLGQNLSEGDVSVLAPIRIPLPRSGNTKKCAKVTDEDRSSRALRACRGCWPSVR